MYTAGGGGYSHTTVAKFQYMPGGQGGGWAPPTAGEASSISGRKATTTADTALRCSHGFIGHLSQGPLRGDSKIRALSGGSNGADGGDHGHDGAGLLRQIRAQLNDLLLLATRAGTPGCR